MKIAVLIKQVPDTEEKRHLANGSGLLDREGATPIIDEINAVALEVALRYKEAGKAGKAGKADKVGNAEVTVVTMGPAAAKDALRKSLAMGADNAVHVLDEALAGSDALQTSAALAAALRDGGYDLVIAGNESTDGRSGAVPAMLAERLGHAQLTFISSVEISDSVVTGLRDVGQGVQSVRAVLPAVISVTEQAAEPRFPTFKGIMSAKRKPLDVASLSDLAVDAVAVGVGNSHTKVLSAVPRPPRAGGQKVHDEGHGGAAIAEFLSANRLI